MNYYNTFTIPCNFKVQHIEDGQFVVFFADGTQLSYQIENTSKVKWIEPEAFSLEQVLLSSKEPINADDIDIIKYASYRLIADTPLIDDDGSNPEPDCLYCKNLVTLLTASYFKSLKHIPSHVGY
jgi:hypothetical protein